MSDVSCLMFVRPLMSRVRIPAMPRFSRECRLPCPPSPPSDRVACRPQIVFLCALALLLALTEATKGYHGGGGGRFYGGGYYGSVHHVYHPVPVYHRPVYYGGYSHGYSGHGYGGYGRSYGYAGGHGYW